MKFDDLDARLRVFETAHDHCALPGLYLVARLDGRGFTRLTKEVYTFEAPFDEQMRDYLKTGFNPLTQQSVETPRRQLTANLELPLGTAYEEFIRSLLPAAE